MLDLVRDESERIDSRFLEPACGSGNFLVPVLRRKLCVAASRYGGSEFEVRHQALLGVMSVYGIELLTDNVEECRQILLDVVIAELHLESDDPLVAASRAVLDLNIVHGDALTMTTRTEPPAPIVFAEWTYLGKGKYHRRDFRFDTMTLASTFSEEGSLFADLGRHEIFTAAQDHGALTVAEIGRGRRADD